ncbi:MAG TPA: ABC transporter ATP-binding protein, partial [Candidatus Polarisedimenticolaceae bacterium]|nr:ABC transporter ATP-binding protein [Candidatus Polarisedimenticolaceae bacterium]
MSELRRLFGYVRPHLGRMVLAAVLLAVAGALMSAMVGTIKPLVNEVLLPSSPAAAPPHASPPPMPQDDLEARVKRVLPIAEFQEWARRHAYVQVPLLIVGIFFVRALFLYFGQYLMTKSGSMVVRDLRSDLYASVAYQSAGFFQAHPTGTILSRILADVQQIQRIMTSVLSDAVRVVAMLPFLVVLVVVQDWRLALVAMVVLPLLAWPMVRLGRRLRRASTRAQESIATAAGLLTESVAGVRVVQSFGMEVFEIGRFRAALGQLLRADLKAARATALAPAVMELVGAAAGASIFYLAGRRIAAGTLDGGRFFVVLVGLGLLYMSVRRLNQLNVELQHALAAATRIFGMMDRRPAITDRPGASVLPPFRQAVRFEGVEFAYDGAPVLREIDLTLGRGEVVALVGRSGSGKSTLANLLPRFYDPTSGRITVDGH